MKKRLLRRAAAERKRRAFACLLLELAEARIALLMVTGAKT